MMMRRMHRYQVNESERFSLQNYKISVLSPLLRVGKVEGSGSMCHPSMEMTDVGLGRYP